MCRIAEEDLGALSGHRLLDERVLLGVTFTNSGKDAILLRIRFDRSSPRTLVFAGRAR